jgi:hypothetical protein
VEAAFAERICQRLGGVAISALDRSTFTPLLREMEEMIWGKKRKAAASGGGDEQQAGFSPN